MRTITFGEVEIAALGGGAPQRARSSNANPAQAVVHLVIVMPNDTEVAAGHRRAPRGALCGVVPRHGRWVFDPTWPERMCAKCERRNP